MSFTLRPDQQYVAAYRKGYMAVPAVPGAGKTTVLACLAADLIAEGYTEPGRILIVTYTNSAVGNFKSRIADFLEQRGCNRSRGYEVRTIHSLAMQIVRRRPELIGWSQDFTIADETALTAILGRLTGSWIARHRDRWAGMIRTDLKGPWRERAERDWEQRTQGLIRNLIQAFKSRKLDPEGARRITRHLPETSALRWAAEIYAEYQRELALLGAVDFGDLMLGAHRVLTQDSELLARLRTRWTYICEDEAQDSYRLQEEVLRLLAGPDGNLVRVGDANQAIMGTFTSAEPDLFRRYCREAGVSVRPLIMAGRSSPDIIDLANELVRWSREDQREERLREALENQQIRPVPPDFAPANPRPDKYTIACRTYRTNGDELQGMAKAAAAMLTRYPGKTLAVLVPTNAMGEDLVKLLEGIGVPVSMLGGPTSAWRMQTATALMDVLAFLGSPHHPDRLLTALAALTHAPVPSDSPLREFLQENPVEVLFDSLAPVDIALDPAVLQLSRWLDLTLLPADELTLRLAADMALAGEELAIACQLANLARRAMTDHPALGLSEVVERLQQEKERGLGRFADSLYDRQGFKAEPGMVWVTTCHAAKGLEWDTVFLAALTRFEFPSVLTDKVRSELWFLPEESVNPEALALAQLDGALGGDRTEAGAMTRAKLEIIAERLRLLYVAVTRARENLLLSHHQYDRFDKQTLPALAYQRLREFAGRKGGNPDAE